MFFQIRQILGFSFPLNIFVDPNDMGQTWLSQNVELLVNLMRSLMFNNVLLNEKALMLTHDSIISVCADTKTSSFFTLHHIHFYTLDTLMIVLLAAMYNERGEYGNKFIWLCIVLQTNFVQHNYPFYWVHEWWFIGTVVSNTPFQLEL